jgi:CrcB protein
MSTQSEPRASGSDDYKMPASYANLDELADPEPIDNPHPSPKFQDDLEDIREVDNRAKEDAASHRNDGHKNEDESDQYMNLDELVGPSPIENPEEHHFSEHHDLEEERTKERTYEDDEAREEQLGENPKPVPGKKSQHLLTHLYVTSYLILFAILGTLARLGITALTSYPSAPVIITEIWANVSGCFAMGYLSEDRFLFRREWIAAQEKHRGTAEDRNNDSDDESPNPEAVLAAAKIEHNAAKKTVPLFIGLAVGFCGSFTTFSSFIRDIFLAMDNGLATMTYTSTGTEIGQTYSRNPGYSVMSVLAVILLEVSLCMCALHVGADFAIALEPILSKLPRANLRRVLDAAIVPLAWGSWLGCIFMAIWPPDRPDGPAANGHTKWAAETWRGKVLFALIFAPIGCLLRFHASLCLNGKLISFPLGTFVVNILGTIILGMSWDLQRAPLFSGLIGGGKIGCQVLQGIEDGFCGCLTTISTWILELKGLQRKHAYIYGASSVGLGLSFLIVVMGSFVWTTGVAPLACAI